MLQICLPNVECRRLQVRLFLTPNRLCQHNESKKLAHFYKHHINNLEYIFVNVRSQSLQTIKR